MSSFCFGQCLFISALLGLILRGNAQYFFSSIEEKFSDGFDYNEYNDTAIDGITPYKTLNVSDYSHCIVDCNADPASCKGMNVVQKEDGNYSCDYFSSTLNGTFAERKGTVYISKYQARVLGYCDVLHYMNLCGKCRCVNMLSSKYSHYCDCTQALSEGQKDCKTIQEAGFTDAAIYNIQNGGKTFKGFCEIREDETLWLTMLRRFTKNFTNDKAMPQYISGFGDPLGEMYWIGLEHLFEFTKNANTILKVEVKTLHDDNWIAEYGDFKVTQGLMATGYGYEASDYRTNYCVWNPLASYTKEFGQCDGVVDFWFDDCKQSTPFLSTMIRWDYAQVKQLTLLLRHGSLPPKEEENPQDPYQGLIVINATASSILKDRTNVLYAWSGHTTENVFFYHSLTEDNPWLQLQLQHPLHLSGLVIIQRKDCCGDRLRDLQVRAGMSEGLGNELVGTFDGPGVSGVDEFVQFSGPVMAEYVTFQIMGDQAILQINGITFIGNVLGKWNATVTRGVRFPAPKYRWIQDGRFYIQGHVEIYYGAEWGTICDNRFDSNDANVVCRMAGYDGGDYKDSYKDVTSKLVEKVWIHNLECVGTEPDIDKCIRENWGFGTENCGAHENVGVRCWSLQMCPAENPFPYHYGQYCCKYNKEKFDALIGDKCNNNDLSITSMCCKDDAYVQCPSGTCNSNAAAGVIPISKGNKLGSLHLGRDYCITFDLYTSSIDKQGGYSKSILYIEKPGVPKYIICHLYVQQGALSISAYLGMIGKGNLFTKSSFYLLEKDKPWINMKISHLTVTKNKMYRFKVLVDDLEKVNEQVNGELEELNDLNVFAGIGKEEPDTRAHDGFIHNLFIDGVQYFGDFSNSPPEGSG